MLVGAVGIELKATLKIRKLFIPLDGKNAKNSGFAQPRYTRGTRPSNTLLSSRLWPTDASRFVVRGRQLLTGGKIGAQGNRPYYEVCTDAKLLELARKKCASPKPKN